MSSLSLQEFDLKQIKMDICGTPRILVYGPTGSGKSLLIVDILYHHQDVPIVTIVSPTERFNHTYKDIVPELFIHDFSKEIIKKFIQRQEFIQDKQKNDPKYKKIDPRAILILDDSLHKIKKISHDEDIDFLFIAGRWVSAAPIFAIQDPIGLSPTQRGQLSYTFIFYDPLETNKKKLFEHYAGVFPNYRMFSDALDYYSQDFGCLVIDHTNKRARKIEEKVFWYQAKKHPKFRMCDEQFWNALKVDQVEDETEKLKNTNITNKSGITEFRRLKKEHIEEYNPSLKWF